MRKINALYRTLKRNMLFSFCFVLILSWGGSKWLDSLLVGYGIPSIMTLVILLFAGVALFYALRWLFRHFLPAPKIVNGSPPLPQRGLIFLLSNEETLLRAVEHHQDRLTHLWLVVTDESKSLGEKVEKELASKLPELKVYDETVENVWDPDDTALAVERVLTHASDVSVKRSDLICDITGGLKTMAIGAMVTCMAEGIRIQMVSADYGEDLNVERPQSVLEIDL